MTIKDIAIRNLLRRKGKAFFILAGLVIGVSTVVGVISLVDAMTNDIKEKLEKYGANILIVPKTENLSLTFGGLSLGGVSFEMEEIRAEALKGIKKIKNAANVAAVGPMVLGVMEIRKQRVLMAGIDFEAARILKPWWRVTGTIPETGEMLLGAEVARILDVRKGDTLEIQRRTYGISGILNPTGSQDDQLIFTRLPTAQFLLEKTGRVSMVEVAALCNACPIDEMVRQIAEVLPGAKVMAIQQVVKSRMETLSHFKTFSYGISVVVMLIGGLVVLVTMMGSVRERTEEIGIFRAIGFRKQHVIRVILIEAGLVSGLAGIVGYFLGFLGTHLAVRFFTESQHVTVPLNPILAINAFWMALFIGLLASSYPALLASRMDPNEALRAL